MQVPGVRGLFRTVLLGPLVTALWTPQFAHGDDASPLVLKSLQFSPAAIDTSRNAVPVTISFTATDSVTGINYFEAAFAELGGAGRQSASVRLDPAQTQANSLRVAFPRFSNAGTWTLDQVFLSDLSGNTLILDNAGLARAGFPTRLEVTSTRDTTSPKLLALDFSPPSIDTSRAPAIVIVEYSASDDLAGVNRIELSFLSPSGGRQNGILQLQPSRAASGSLPITFPRLSEAGRWTLTTVYLSDAAGNTQILDGEALSAARVRTDLDVKSATDTTPPKISSLRFAPGAVDISHNPVTVEASFTATDDFSGVTSVEVVLTSPSGNNMLRGTGTFAPATNLANAVKIAFPRFSEPGRWITSAVHLADAAGNTLILDGDSLSALGLRGAVEVRAAPDTVAPVLTHFEFEPETIDTSSGPVVLRLKFAASDNSSGVKSVEAVLESPSGGTKRSGRASFAPAASVTESVVIIFPQSSEPGSWILSNLIVVDDAGNTLQLDADTLASYGKRFLVVR